MKTIILLSALVFSLQAMAVQDKCYETAKKAAFNYAVAEEMVTDMNEFGMDFGNENLEIVMKKGWQKEFWAFGNGSMFINVTIDAVKNKCIVKSIDIAQDDQDHE